MNAARPIQSKIHNLKSMMAQMASWRVTGKKVAFTNGVFDILHAGHLQSLNEAAFAADFLVVALNSDASVKRLKGESRPVNAEQDRLQMMAALMPVDGVLLFHEDTPLEVIKALKPDVLVKGGDYTLQQIVGAQEVMAAGGQVIINGIKEGYSTTATIERMQKK